jgi:hypothetical protein
MTAVGLLPFGSFAVPMGHIAACLPMTICVLSRSVAGNGDSGRCGSAGFGEQRLNRYSSGLTPTGRAYD